MTAADRLDLTRREQHAGRVQAANPGACTIRLDGPHGRFCGRSPARPAVMACVHEHFEPAVICDRCRLGLMFCELCAAAGCIDCPQTEIAV